MTPVWMPLARRYLGLREAPGSSNNPTIMGWAKRLGVKVLGMVYGNDATPWCGLFVAAIVAEAGLTPPPIAVRAKSWATWGEACQPGEGALLVFERPGGGHIGFYAGERDDAYQVLGGNQGDAVSLAWIAKARCVAVRWPAAVRPIGAPIRLANDGGRLSANEA